MSGLRLTSVLQSVVSRQLVGITELIFQLPVGLLKSSLYSLHQSDRLEQHIKQLCIKVFVTDHLNTLDYEFEYIISSVILTSMFFYQIDKIWRFILGVKSLSDNEDEMTEDDLAALKKTTNKSQFLFHSKCTATHQQCRLNTWPHWAVAREPHEYRAPLLIYVPYVVQVCFF